MSSGPTHRAVSGLVLGIGIALWELNQSDELTWRTPTCAGLAWLSGTLPDIFEPAAHPNHRQFFHSVVFGFILGSFLYRLWKWEPEEAWQKFLKLTGIAVISSYLIHLVMDSRTAKSLPLLGKV